MAERVYGHISGCPVGALFANRKAAQAAGIHRPGQAGISGGTDGADSIVVSGGYPDDEDYGDELIYTGQGGQDEAGKRQVADQEFTRGNVGLARSQLDGRPVRVIRGAGGDPRFSPATGLRYDGLFAVTNHWHETGRDGFLIWRYRLVKLPDDHPETLPAAVKAELQSGATALPGGPAPREAISGDRAVRDPKVRDNVLRWHKHTCQICGVQLVTAAGPSAVGAHIQGLGRPHKGIDHESNMLCLCPNDHLLFDNGALYIDSGLKVWNALTNDVVGWLRTTPKHIINETYLAYHRTHMPAAR